MESVSFIDEHVPQADVQVCYLDDSAICTNLVEHPMGPTQWSTRTSAQIRIRYTLVTEDGSWQLFHGQNISEMSLGATTCESEL